MRAVPATGEPGHRATPMTAESPPGYPGETLGLPKTGSGSLAPMGRRLLALLIDWLIAYGLALLALELGAFSKAILSTAVLVIWLVLPPLFTDAEGRGLQDRLTGTAVVRR